MKAFTKRFAALLTALLLAFSLCSCEVIDEILGDAVSFLEAEGWTELEPSLPSTIDEGKLRPVGTGTATPLKSSQIPKYSGSPFVTVCGNVPDFSVSELMSIGVEDYSELDALGRCGAAFAVCGREIMPEEGEKRGSISSIKPSGWVQHPYDFVDGGQLYNRAHLIGWQLSAENANRCNLVTGTRYMNTRGMLPFENMIADYIKETNGHVAYRVTPVFVGSELVCRGVQLEAYSIEDLGDGICFNVFCFNVQPGVVIDYLTGESEAESE